MAKHTPISYYGNRAAVNKIKVLAQLKNISMGKLVAIAIEQTYGDELRMIDESLLAMSDRLNEQSSARTHSRSN